MTEFIEIYQHKDDRIYSVVHIPNQISQYKKKVMIIFLHGWAGYRIGPHGMLIDIARNLTDCGFFCCRFDFRGRGYSTGISTDTNLISMFEDLEIVLLNLKAKYNPDEINLLGMCSGGKLAILYGRNGSQKINHIIGLSSDLLSANVNIRQKELSYKSKEYLKKIFLKSTWRKLFTLEINFRLIIRDFFFKYEIKQKKEQIHQLSINNSIEFNSPFFSNFTGKALLIHAEKDPTSENSIKQIKNLLNKYKKDYSVMVIPNANHNFYSLVWKNEIIIGIKKWISELYSLL